MAKFFQKILMESETVNSQNRTALYQESGVNASVYAGGFVVPTGMADNAIYSAYTSGVKDFNTLTVAPPTSATPTAGSVYVIDFVKVSDGTINGNVYREGAKTLGLMANAGEKIAIRKVAFNDVFELSKDNFTTTPTVGQYAILGTTVDAVPNATVPAAGFTIKVEQKTTVSQGVTANSDAYICRAVQL